MLTALFSPDAGFECETVAMHGRQYQVWDLQGEPAQGLPRKHYFAGQCAIVHFVDSSQPRRFGDSAAALADVLSADTLPPGAVVLVLANKQDQQEACSAPEVAAALGLQDLLEHRQWHIAPCVASDVGSLREALQWLQEQELVAL